MGSTSIERDAMGLEGLEKTSRDVAEAELSDSSLEAAQQSQEKPWNPTKLSWVSLKSHRMLM
jgi:hypothetical protein